MNLRTLAPALLLLGLSACDGESASAPAGPSVAIDVAALNLQGVGDVVWDLEVLNGAGTPQVVWQRRITSSGYGDGAGSASYVGPCDAQANPNVVRVWVVGLYSGDVSAANAGAFNSTHDGVTGTAIAFQNPTTPAAPLTRSITCTENADVAVQFDVALMRPAQQGFFDIAVNFNNIFCAAKFDCCADTGDGTCASAEDIKLLFDATGTRARTFVLGFACTAGPDDDVDTELYMSALELDCDGGSPFAPTLAIAPGGTSGNRCDAGNLSACSAFTVGAAAADTYLYQVGTYRGSELLSSGGASAQKVYWNIALGVKPAISSCHLRVRATADDAANDGDGVDAGVIAAGAVYPYVQWDLSLGATCASEALALGGTSTEVAAAYTQTSGAATSFAYTYAPSAPPVTARTCAQVLAANPSATNGLHTIDVDGPTGPTPPLQVYCDMTGGGFTLVTNIYDSAGDDAPNAIATATAGWQQTASGVFSTTLTKIDRDISGLGSAALPSSAIKNLWDGAGATVLRLCLVSTTNTEICRTSGDVAASLTLTTPPAGLVNTTLLQYHASSGCTGAGCAAAYTYGRLMGLPASRNDYTYTSFSWGGFCIGRTSGLQHQYGTNTSYSLCEHNDSDVAGWRGVWHGWGEGISFRPWETGDNEMGNLYGANPSATSYGFRLYLK